MNNDESDIIAWDFFYQGRPLMEILSEINLENRDSAFQEPEESNDDDYWHQLGFDLFSDPRSCINRKKY